MSLAQQILIRVFTAGDKILVQEIQFRPPRNAHIKMTSFPLNIEAQEN